MIVLFTDFGETGPYVGQVKLVLALKAPGIQVIELLHDAPRFQPRASSYLLASLVDVFPTGAVFLCVVDPGVGGTRDAIVVEADGRWYVGPDNGLFEIVCRRANECRAWTITWQPDSLSASFHGRDLFAPVASAVARGLAVPGEPRPVETVRRLDWPDDLAEIIYVDHFGNAMTGLRAAKLPRDARLTVAGMTLSRTRTFSDVPPGRAFWYENSNGLVEIAVNQGRAADLPGIAIGGAVTVSAAQ